MVVIEGPAVHLCKWAGNLSYPFYILHWPALLALQSVFKRIKALSTYESTWPYLALAIALCATHLIQRYYELPTRRWLGVRLATA